MLYSRGLAWALAMVCICGATNSRAGGQFPRSQEASDASTALLSLYVAQVGLELAILLPQPSK